jgi:hypothetical protein
MLGERCVTLWKRSDLNAQQRTLVVQAVLGVLPCRGGHAILNPDVIEIKRKDTRPGPQQNGLIKDNRVFATFNLN